MNILSQLAGVDKLTRPPRYNTCMEAISDLFGNYRLAVPEGKGKRSSERAELMKYLLQKLNNGRDTPMAPAHLGFRISHLSLPDLYYMKSVGEDYERRGKGPFAKYFWGALKVKS